MSNINLEANLTKDPVLAFTADNTPVANLSVAENRRYQQGTEWKSDVAYYDCAVFGQMAQYVVDSLHKGDMVVITGRMQFREWEDAATKQRRTKLEVRVFSIGASLKFARVDVKKVAREDNGTTTVSEPEEAPVAATGTEDVI